MKRRALFRRLVVGSVLLLLAIVVSATWALGTRSGARTVLSGLVDVVPGRLSLQLAEGSLAGGRLLVEDLEWTAPDPTVSPDDGDAEPPGRPLQLRIAGIEMLWSPAALVGRRLEIERLEIREVTLDPGSSDADDGEDPEPPRIDLPIDVSVADLEIRDLEIVGPGGSDPTVVDRIHGTALRADDPIRVDRLEVRGPGLDVRVSGRLLPRDDLPLELEGRWSLSNEESTTWAGRGTLSGSLAGSGGLEISQDLARPVEGHLDATLRHAFADPEVDAELRISAVSDPEGPADSMPAELLPLHAHARAVWNGERLTVEQLTLDRTVGEARLEVAGHVASDGGLDLRAAWNDLAWPPEDARAGGETDNSVRSPRGRATITGTLDDFEWTLGSQLESSQQMTAEIDAEGSGTGDQVSISRLVVKAGGGTIRGGGSVRWTPDLQWTASLEGRGLDPSRLVPSLPGAAASTADRWTFEARGDGSGLELHRLQGALAGGELDLSGNMSWSPHLEWTAEGTLRELDPGTLVSGWQGAVGASLATSGRWASGDDTDRGTIDADLRVERIRGDLRGRKLDGEISLHVAGFPLGDGPGGGAASPETSTVDLVWGGAALRAEGRLGEELDVEARIEAPDLSLFTSSLGGSLQLDAEVSGPARAPEVRADLHLEDLAHPRAAADSVEGSVSLGAAPERTVDLEVEARDVRPAPSEGPLPDLSIVRVNVEGNRESHTIDVEIRTTAGGAVEVAAVGDLDPADGWIGEPTKLRLSPVGGDAWTLQRSGRVVASTDRLILDELCLESEEARLCAAARWPADGARELRLDASSIPLVLAEPLLPPDLRLRGTLDGRAELRSEDGGPLLGTADLRPGPGAVLYSTRRQEELHWTFEKGRLDLDARPDAASVVGALDFDAGTVDVNLDLPPLSLDGDFASAPLDGTVRVRASDVAFLEALVPDLGPTTGRLEIEIRPRGTVESPRLAGRVTLADGETGLPELGLRLEEVELVASSSEPGEPWQIRGGATSGGGRLRVEGQLPIGPVVAEASEEAGPETELSFRGDDVLVSDTARARVVASPDLRLVGDGSSWALEGSVRVPTARIDLGFDDPDVVRASDDVVIVRGGEDLVSEPADEGLAIGAEVRLVLGDDVRIEGRGLDARIEGSLLVVDEAGRPTRARGELEVVEGTYRAYGQNLTIETGRLVFQGPLDRPEIHLRAFRKTPEGVVAGIQVDGPLEQPEATLWSEPEMGRSETLSTLLLGRPSVTGGGGDGDLLGAAATSLGLKGGSWLAETMQEQFGLEEARIDTSAGTDEASLVLGTYLSPRFYVSYGIGLFDPTSTLRIRYLLSEHWSLFAETGRESGGDLVYSIETGGPEPAKGDELAIPDDLEGEAVTLPSNPRNGSD